MYQAINPSSIETLEHIVSIMAEKKHDARIAELTADLKLAADEVVRAARSEEDHRTRSAAQSVADGLIAAAEICVRMQEASI